MLVSSEDWSEPTVRPRRPRMVFLGAKRSDPSTDDVVATLMQGPEVAGKLNRQQLPRRSDLSALRMGKRNAASDDDDRRLQQQLSNSVLYLPSTRVLTSHPAAAAPVETFDRKNSCYIVIAAVPAAAVATRIQLDTTGSDPFADRKLNLFTTSQGEKEFELPTEQQRQRRMARNFVDVAPTELNNIRIVDNDDSDDEEKEGIDDDDDVDDWTSTNDDTEGTVSRRRVRRSREPRKDAARRPAGLLRMGRRSSMAADDSDPVVVGDGVGGRMWSDGGRRRNRLHDASTGDNDEGNLYERYFDGMSSESDVDDDEGRRISDVVKQSKPATTLNGRRSRGKMNVARIRSRPVQLLRMGKRLAIGDLMTMT